MNTKAFESGLSDGRDAVVDFGDKVTAEDVEEWFAAQAHDERHAASDQ